VVLAHSASEAREAARRGWLDGALIHVHAGGSLGGLRVAEMLRAMEGLTSLPLGFSSARRALEDQVVPTYAGGSLFLPRPFSAEELLAAAERFAALRSTERAR